MSEKLSAMQNSIDFKKSDDSLRENQDLRSLEQLNFIAKQQRNQRKYHEN